MPPKENDKLSAKQIQYFREWIEVGAPWPSRKVQHQIKAAERKKIQTDEGIIVKNSGGLSDDWTYRRYKPEDLWAFQPVQKPKISASLTNPIDYFVGKKLDETQINPAPTADFRSLVKRAYLDLHGLPPTPYEIYQFRLSWDKNPEKLGTNFLTNSWKVNISENAQPSIGLMSQDTLIQLVFPMIMNDPTCGGIGTMWSDHLMRINPMTAL